MVDRSDRMWSTGEGNGKPLQYSYLENPMNSMKRHVAAAAAAKSLQSCPTLRPHRWQPTGLPHPWDSPGKNIGVGCHLGLSNLLHYHLLFILTVYQAKCTEEFCKIFRKLLFFNERYFLALFFSMKMS